MWVGCASNTVAQGVLVIDVLCLDGGGGKIASNSIHRQVSENEKWESETAEI